MPIGGFVLTIREDRKEPALKTLSGYEQVEVVGTDGRGNVVVVMETATSHEMERLVEDIRGIEDVTNVGLAYLHREDEILDADRTTQPS